MQLWLDALVMADVKLTPSISMLLISVEYLDAGKDFLNYRQKSLGIPLHAVLKY
jgi:hypothetical protein